MANRFLHRDLGHCKRGEGVEVTLSGSAANVLLLDSSNFSAYRNGRRYSYHGGLAKRSPVHLTIPRAGRWYVVVDMQGLKGRTNASIRMLPRPLPEIRQTPLSSMPSLVRETHAPSARASVTDERACDVFIAHASEDKDDVARPLADALTDAGLSVWYDEFALKLGDSIRRSIDQGIGQSRFGVVVLSKSFFEKGWTQYELDGLVTRAVSDEQVLLPIWHDITKQEVIKHSPSLADRVARNTTAHTILEIAEEIVDVVRPTQ